MVLDIKSSCSDCRNVSAPTQIKYRNTSPQIRRKSGKKMAARVPEHLNGKHKGHHRLSEPFHKALSDHEQIE